MIISPAVADGSFIVTCNWRTVGTLAVATRQLVACLPDRHPLSKTCRQVVRIIASEMLPDGVRLHCQNLASAPGVPFCQRRVSRHVVAGKLSAARIDLPCDHACLGGGIRSPALACARGSVSERSTRAAPAMESSSCVPRQSRQGFHSDHFWTVPYHGVAEPLILWQPMQSARGTAPGCPRCGNSAARRNK